MKNYPGKRTRNWCPRKPINGRCFSYANWKVFMLILQFYLFFTKPLFTVSYSSILFACTVLNLTNQEKNRLERPRKIAQRIIVIDLPNIESRYIKQSIDKVKSIMKDITHPLNSCYIFNRSCIRLCHTPTRLSRFRNSFIPDSIHIFNSFAHRWKVEIKKLKGGIYKLEMQYKKSKGVIYTN